MLPSVGMRACVLDHRDEMFALCMINTMARSSKLDVCPQNDKSWLALSSLHARAQMLHHRNEFVALRMINAVASVCACTR